MMLNVMELKCFCLNIAILAVAFHDCLHVEDAGVTCNRKWLSNKLFYA